MRPHELQRFGSSYPGGKAGSGVAQRIINLMPPHQVYIEPFLGAGAVLLRKRPAQLNIGVDRDPQVIARWTAAPSPTTAAAEVAETDVTVPNAKRRRPSRSLTTSDAAAHPDSAGNAAQSAGSRSTPGPAADSRGMRSRAACSSVASSGGTVLRWEFHCTDGIEFLRSYPFTGRELVYCDPPYLHETRKDLKLYEFEMTKAQHRALLQVIRKLPCPVLISGYESALYGMHLQSAGWNTVNYTTMTRRGPAIETLWWNFPAPLELHDYRYLGNDRRERERIKRKQARWGRKLAAMDRLERQALLSVLGSTADESSGSARSFEASIPSHPKQRGALAPSVPLLSNARPA